jgi:hypothetical protein
MRRLWVRVAVAFPLALALVLTAIPSAHAASSTPFRGLGTWVDVFDYAPRLQRKGALPPFTVRSVDDMADVGVRTLYVQVANPDNQSAASLTDRKQLKPIIARARERGLQVVVWYLPSLVHPDRDTLMLEHIVGLHVDGIGLDLESTDPANVALRSRRAVEFTKQARKLAGNGTPLAAIVYPPVQLDSLNLALWPGFPYKQIAPYVDLWMPMAYYTYRSPPLRSAYIYSVASVTALRKHLGADVPVHLIGGIGDATTVNDIVDLRRAARATQAIGWSLYDYVTTSSSDWPYLRR